MFARFAVSVALGTIVTFALLFVMQLMVASGRGELTEARTFRLHEFVRVDRSETVERRTRERMELPDPEPRPDRPQPERRSSFETQLAVSIERPSLSTELSISGTSFAGGDGEYLPLLKVAPVYPTRALARKLEGHVLVEFAVTPAGSVKDVVVIESTNEIFEKPAIEAALKFKYRPRVVDGQPIEVRGVRNKITFAMQV